jgi:hypothetical protein
MTESQYDSDFNTWTQAQAAAHPLQRKAALVGRVQRLRQQGKSLQEIAADLNANGVPTLSGRGVWRKGTVSNLLAEADA